MMYEGYGPGGVALLIHAVTDNPTRTVAEVRFKLSRFNGNLGASNSVAWMFERKGQIYIDATKYEEDAAMEAALEGGAEDFVQDGEQYIVSTEPVALHEVRSAIEAKGVVVQEAEIAMIPKSTVHVEGKTAESLLRLMDELDGLDDVQKVEANFDIDLAELAKA
jgi:YebC/PmpR family DNA-binding regulatory protein